MHITGLLAPMFQRYVVPRLFWLWRLLWSNLVKLPDFGFGVAFPVAVFVQVSCSVGVSDEAVTRMSANWQPFFRTSAFYGFIGSTIFIFGLSLVEVARKKTLFQLEREIHRLSSQNGMLNQNIRNLVEGYLYRLGEGPLNFGKETENTERITFYLFFEPKGKFVPIGRYSKVYDFSQPGEVMYDASKGCIGQAWKNDWFFCSDFPDPVESRDEYIEKHLRFGVAKSVVKKLKMKSRLYCGCKIYCKQGREPLAVIVLESTNPDRFSEHELRKVFEGNESKFLADLAEVTRDHVADPSEIQNMGL